MGRTPTGSPIALSSADRQHRHIWLYGDYEPEVAAALHSLVKPGSVVYDVGANAGYFALIARDLGAEVHAFEPNPETRALLERSRAADPAGLTIVPAACGSEAGTMPLFVREETNSGMSTLRASEGRHFDVDVVTLDDYAARTGTAPDVVKMDVEGYELEALQGARRLLRSAQPALIVETSHQETIAFMDGLGYDAQLVTGEGPGARFDAAQASGGWENVLFRPRGGDGDQARAPGSLADR